MTLNFRGVLHREHREPHGTLGHALPLHWESYRWATTQHDDPEQELLSVQRLGFWCARQLCQTIACESSLNGLPQVVWGPMAWDAITMGHNFRSNGALPDAPFEFYEHVGRLLELLKQALLTFRFLLSALTRLLLLFSSFPIL